MRETDLYGPLKRFLEQQGYEVKAEVGAADVVGVRGGEPPLIVETKTSFSALAVSSRDRAPGDHRPGLHRRAGRPRPGRCASFLSEHGPTKAALVASGSGVARARRIMADNHYGWFQRVGTGIYDLTPNTI